MKDYEEEIFNNRIWFIIEFDLFLKEESVTLGCRSIWKLERAIVKFEHGPGWSCVVMLEPQKHRVPSLCPMLYDVLSFLCEVDTANSNKQRLQLKFMVHSEENCVNRKDLVME